MTQTSSASTTLTSKATFSVVSFGYRHRPGAPQADVIVDLRKRLRDPHIDPQMRQMTGKDEAVRRNVMNTPGAHELLAALEHIALAMVVPGVPLTIALGCEGGRHRSVVLGDELAARLNGRGQEARHRDIKLPVVERAKSSGADSSAVDPFPRDRFVVTFADQNTFSVRDTVAKADILTGVPVEEADRACAEANGLNVSPAE